MSAVGSHKQGHLAFLHCNDCHPVHPSPPHTAINNQISTFFPLTNVTNVLLVSTPFICPTIKVNRKRREQENFAFWICIHQKGQTFHVHILFVQDNDKPTSKHSLRQTSTQFCWQYYNSNNYSFKYCCHQTGGKLLMLFNKFVASPSHKSPN